MQLLASPADPPRLVVETRPVENDAAVVRLRGEADLHTASVLRDAVEQAISTNAGLIVIDLSRATFVDSMMLGVLLDATRRTRLHGTEMRLVVEDPHVRRIFELTLLNRVVALYPTLQPALTR